MINDVAGKILYTVFAPFVKMPQVLSIYFHNPTPEAFERVVIWVREKGYDFIDVPYLLKYMRGENNDGKKHCIVTFDDAWRNNLKLLPIIEKYKVPITIFSPITPLIEGNYWWEYVFKKGGEKMAEKYKTYDEYVFRKEVESIKKEMTLSRTAMTIEELKELSKHPLVDIQSHSYTHPILTHLSEESLEFEIGDSKKFLAKELNNEIYAFCYPNGSLTPRETDFASRHYECAFSTIQGYPCVGGDLYTIPRYALTDCYGSNLAKMLGVWKWFRK